MILQFKCQCVGVNLHSYFIDNDITSKSSNKVDLILFIKQVTRGNLLF